MNIIYRKPKLDELEQLCMLNDYLFELSIKNFDSTLNKDWKNSKNYKQFFKKYFAENLYLLVAYDGSEMIGYVSGSVYPTEEYREKMLVAEIENLMILPDYQNKGVGKHLIESFNEWAKNQKANRLKVSVYSKNTHALNYYKKLGFQSYDESLEKEI